MNRRDDKGLALVAVLGVMIVTLPLAAHLLLTTQISGLLARNLHAQTQCLYTAESGVAFAMAALDASAASLAAPPRPLASDPTGTFPHEPYRYTTSIRYRDKRHVEIISVCTGPRRVQRKLRVIVEIADTEGARGDRPRIVAWEEVAEVAEVAEVDG